jgi:hypothetical protein
MGLIRSFYFFEKSPISAPDKVEEISKLCQKYKVSRFGVEQTTKHREINSHLL